MTTKDQIAIAKLYMENFSPQNEQYKLIVIGKYLGINNKKTGEPQTLMTFSSYGEPEEPEWPNYDKNVLRKALMDAVNTGKIPDVSSVILPDGTPFEVDGPIEDTDASPEGYWY